MNFSLTSNAGIARDGWGMLSPWGDFPGTGLVCRGEDYERCSIVQRLDREAGAAMLQSFRAGGSVALYEGHPDKPGHDGERSGMPVGAITDLELRQDGIWARAAFSNESAAREFHAFSGHWEGTPVTTKEGLTVVRPVRLKSVGLTNNPALPVAFWNERSESDWSNCSAAERGARVQELVNAARAKGLGYDAAFARVERENPDLFLAMRRPDGRI